MKEEVGFRDAHKIPFFNKLLSFINLPVFSVAELLRERRSALRRGRRGARAARKAQHPSAP